MISGREHPQTRCFACRKDTLAIKFAWYFS
jgi:hypothetical protein